MVKSRSFLFEKISTEAYIGANSADGWLVGETPL